MTFNFSDRVKNLEGNAIREIFKLLQNPNIISFAGGLPASKALPLDKIADITAEILASKQAISILQYGATEGYMPLLDSGIQYVARRGITNITRENILAVSGGQQGIDLMCKAFINKGDRVLVEDPTYLAVLHILKTYEAEAIGIKSSDLGIDLADLEDKIIKYSPKIIYLVPTFSNPTGRTIPVEKRKAIAMLASKYNVMVLEDDPYCELRYEGEHLPSIKSFDLTGNVVYVTSFSKTISPGLRVGLAVGDPTVIRKLTIGKQATDVHTNTLAQAIVDLYLRRGYLDPNLVAVIPEYKIKKDAMITALKKYFPQEISYTNPQGGIFIWVELPIYMDANALFKTAVANNVAYVTGNAFYADGRGSNTLRLNFSNASLEQIDIGMSKLGEIIKNAVK